MFDGGEITAAPQLSLADINVTPTMTERLRREREGLIVKLAEIEAALAASEAHPEVQQVIDALTKLHWLR